eukprot:2177564-Rhodomonas_salina.1
MGERECVWWAREDGAYTKSRGSSVGGGRGGGERRETGERRGGGEGGGRGGVGGGAGKGTGTRGMGGRITSLSSEVGRGTGGERGREGGHLGWPAWILIVLLFASPTTMVSPHLLLRTPSSLFPSFLPCRFHQLCDPYKVYNVLELTRPPTTLLMFSSFGTRAQNGTTSQALTKLRGFLAALLKSSTPNLLLRRTASPRSKATQR